MLRYLYEEKNKNGDFIIVNSGKILSFNSVVHNGIIKHFAFCKPDYTNEIEVVEINKNLKILEEK